LEEVKKKPTKADYEKYLQIMKQPTWPHEEIGFLNEYDFGITIFEVAGNYGIKNCIDEILVSAKFEHLYTFSFKEYKEGDLLAVMFGKKWGMIRIGDENKWVLEPVYDYIGFPNAITFVKKDNKYGVINLNWMEFIIPIGLDFVTSENGLMFCNGISTYGKGGKEGVIMDNGEFTEAIFDEIEVPEMGQLIQVRIGEEWGGIDNKGLFTDDLDEAYYYTFD
jgi:hypothetical protein